MSTTGTPDDRLAADRRRPWAGRLVDEEYFQGIGVAAARRFRRRVAGLHRAAAMGCNPAEDQRQPFLAQLRNLAARPQAVASKAPAFGPAVTQFCIEDGPKTTELWVAAGCRCGRGTSCSTR